VHQALEPLIMDPRRFSSGQFYGVPEIRRDDAGFGFVSMAATAREEDVEEHVHDTAHFVLVLAGVYITSAEGAPELACSPTLVFNPAGTRHRDRFLGGVGRFLAITVAGAGANLAEAGARTPDRAVRLHDPYAVRAALAIEQQLRTARPARLALAGAAWQLLDGPPPEASPGTPPSWLRTAQEMIRDCQTDLTIAEVAAHVGVHPVHLARVFRRWLGCAPGEYLRGRRLERAASLVGHSALSLAEIAAESGFVDQAHLGRMFRRAFATTPGTYRRLRDVSRIQDRPRSPA
jgi:AraC family transcriptional regulator